MLLLTLLIKFAHNHMGQGWGQAHGSFSLMAVSCLLRCTCHIVGNAVMQPYYYRIQCSRGKVCVLGCRKKDRKTGRQREKDQLKARKNDGDKSRGRALY